MAVRHVVMFRFAPGTTEEQRARIVEELRGLRSRQLGRLAPRRLAHLFQVRLHDHQLGARSICHHHQ